MRVPGDKYLRITINQYRHIFVRGMSEENFQQLRIIEGRKAFQVYIYIYICDMSERRRATIIRRLAGYTLSDRWEDKGLKRKQMGYSTALGHHSRCERYCNVKAYMMSPWT